MKNFEEFKKDIERELMVKIIMGLRYGKISQSKAETLAQEYLELMEVSNTDELFTNMSKLIERYSEMLEVYLKTATEYFTQRKEELLHAGRQYMQQSQYDNAVYALKGGKRAEVLS
ncbi:MAG TPA: hypothetical protein PLD54_01675 [Candidatus Levybacteria bacterium]|nr:hypothetical protein [Candidatus Levybacteria bacterium]